MSTSSFKGFASLCVKIRVTSAPEMFSGWYNLREEERRVYTKNMPARNEIIIVDAREINAENIDDVLADLRKQKEELAKDNEYVYISLSPQDPRETHGNRKERRQFTQNMRRNIKRFSRKQSRVDEALQAEFARRNDPKYITIPEDDKIEA